MSSERPHAKYSFSKLPILALCPAYESDGKTSEAAERGTEIHEQLQDFVLNGVIRDDAPEWGVNALRDLCDPAMTWTAEDHLDTGIEACSGYPDLLGTDGWGNYVVVEMKTGRSKRAKAIQNQQLIAQCLAVFHDHDDCDSVTGYMLEIDKESYSSVAFARSDIPEMTALIEGIIAKAKDHGRRDLNCGMHCKWCKHGPHCPALGNYPAAVAEVAPVATKTPEEIKEWAHELQPLELADILDRVLPKCELVAILEGALKARAMELLELGEEVRGYGIKTTSGTRSWDSDKDAVPMIAERFGKEAIDAAVVLASPAQVEKNIAKVSGLKAKEIKEALAPFVTTGKRKSLIKAEG